MNDFKQYLIQTYKNYPKATLQDYIKLIFQSEFAGGHMIKSRDFALQYLTDELSSIEGKNVDLYEYISPSIVRINLEAYKYHQLDTTKLINLFIDSANLNYPNITINSKVETLQKLIKNMQIIINDYLDTFLNDFKLNPQPVHHSKQYREYYNPHYRVINSSLLPLEFKVLKLQNYLDSLPKDKLTIIALEGRCASGKTTITNLLKNVTIIHADDFFSKTDVLDFKSLESLLSKLELNKQIEYTTYNCMNDTYTKKTILKTSNVVIVEGVYSYHQKIRKHFDKLIYIEADKTKQLERLKIRSTNTQLLDKFINIWIPREEEYYLKNELIIKSDLII